MRSPFKYIFVLACLLTGAKTMAQADISMATHWYNRANFNPATIARTDYLYIFSNLRQQWSGINGAPKTLNIQSSQYFHNIRSAFGVSFVGDKIGATHTLNPMISYAYRLSKSDDWALSMGLSAGVITRRLDGTAFRADVIDDPSIPYSGERKTAPDINSGIEFQNVHYIFGVSSTHLLSIFKPSSTFNTSNHRYCYAIYRNTAPLLFNYNIGLQMVNRQNLTFFEGNICFRFKRQTGLINGIREIFDVGLTYRTSRQATLLLGMNISPDIRAGYAYDHSFNPGFTKNLSHEIMIEWRIPRKSASTKFKCSDAETWYQ